MFLLDASKSNFKERKKNCITKVFITKITFLFWNFLGYFTFVHENELCVFLLTYPLCSKAKMNKYCQLKVVIGRLKQWF